MAEEKIYVGNGKEHVFGDGGKIIKLRIGLDNLKKYHELYGFTTDAGKHMITLIVSERREKDQYGNSHFVTVDTFKPDPSRLSNHASKAAPSATPPDKDDGEIPF